MLIFNFCLLSTIDAICATVFYLLQTMMPCGKTAKKNQKFTIKDSQENFIAICQTEQSYKEAYDFKVKKNSSVPPFISIVGSLLQPKTILVDYDNIMYQMQSLPKAIDICLKVYHLFSIEYSPPARCMWQFVNLYFYQLPDTRSYPSVYMLIKAIKGILKYKTQIKLVH